MTWAKTMKLTWVDCLEMTFHALITWHMKFEERQHLHHKWNGCGQLVHRNWKMKTHTDFSESFLFWWRTGSIWKYLPPSLKEQTRRKRNHRKTTYYHIKNNILIKNISLKDFLSGTRTKDELTEYLAKKIVCNSRGPSNRLKRCMVTSGTTTSENL